MKINIACSADENFIEPLVVMLSSINRNTTMECNVSILDGGLSEDSKENIISTFQISNLKISIITINKSRLPENLKTTENITLTSYFRILLPHIISNDIDKIIYLDCDLLVEGDIKELWYYPLADYSVMAVPEMSEKAHFVSSQKGLLLYNKLGIPENNKYFNAGVLVINLKKWRLNNISEQIFQYLDVNREYVLWHDQDGLNAILWNDWKELPSEWNVMTAFYRKEIAYKNMSQELQCDYIQNNTKIIHFTNRADKPWKISCLHPLKEKYFEYKGRIKGGIK